MNWDRGNVEVGQKFYERAKTILKLLEELKVRPLQHERNITWRWLCLQEKERKEQEELNKQAHTLLMGSYVGLKLNSDKKKEKQKRKSMRANTNDVDNRTVTYQTPSSPHREKEGWKVQQQSTIVLSRAARVNEYLFGL